MGYDVKQTDANFAIRFANFESACKALEDMVEKRQQLNGINAKEVLSACRRHDFFAAMRICGWECDGNEKGINGITYCCDTLGYDDLIVLKTIAPFVKSGSYIEMLGGEGEKWRWLFKNGDCMEEKALILYPSDPVYVVTCDWIKDCEGGIAVLGVTQNLKTAQRIMQEEIETEKRESWIDDVSPEDIAVLIEDEENINYDREATYVESRSEDEWYIALNGCYCTTHTAITVHTTTLHPAAPIPTA